MPISLSDEVESALAGMHLIHPYQPGGLTSQERQSRCGLIVDILNTVAYGPSPLLPICTTCDIHSRKHPHRFVPPKGLGE